MTAVMVLTGLGTALLLIAAHPFVTYPLSLLLLAQRNDKRTADGGQPERSGRRTADSGQDAFSMMERKTEWVGSGSGLEAGDLRFEVELPNCPLSAVRFPLSPSFALCMCAYNEEAVIERKARNLLALKARHPRLAIHVYVDAATDRTAEILRRYDREFDLHVATERHGKTHGMNLLAARAQADILVFTDANVMLDMECLAAFERYFADPAVGCVSGNLVYTNGSDSATAASGSLYWRFEEALKRLEGRTGSVMGADGSVFAVRRSLHRPPPDHIIDDLFVSMQVLCQGYRILQATDARGYEESVTSPREEFRRKVRIACQSFNVHRLLWPQLRRLDALNVYKYVSHKLIRWLAIYFLAFAVLAYGAALVLAGRWQLALSGLLVFAAGFALGRFAAVKPFAQLTEILAAFCGTGLGVWQSLRGERYQTWNLAASIRSKQAVQS